MRSLSACSAWKWTMICAVALGLLTAVPHMMHTMSPKYQGMAVQRDKDYANYHSRLERALLGYPQESDNGITGIHEHIQGSQIGAMEAIIAMLFGWTQMDAPELSVYVTAIFTALNVILLFGLFCALEFSGGTALTMTLILFAVMFHGLSRVMHPGWSDVFLFSALWAVFAWYKKPQLILLILAASLLALLPYLYFWSWTYSWAVVGVFAMITLIHTRSLQLFWKWALMALVILLLSAPFLLHTSELTHHPLYPELSIRASFLAQRTPESWVRSILLVIQLIALLSLWKKFSGHRKYQMVVAFLLGIVVALHQNVIHNQVLMFASHYEPHMIISALIVGVWAWQQKIDHIRKGIIVGIAALLVGAGFYDYAFAHEFFVPNDQTYTNQHLAPVIAELKKEGMQTVLSDGATSRIVTSYTDDGTIYASHARFLLISDRELARRYCVSQAFSVKTDPVRVLSLEYNRILQSPEYQAYEQKLITEECTKVRANIPKVLKEYGVTRVLWNKTEAPDWKVNAEKVGLTLNMSGSGWTLWNFDPLR